MNALEKLQNKSREERTPLEQCIVDAATFEEAVHDGETELMEQAANDLLAMDSQMTTKYPIFEITHNNLHPALLHVTLVAATQMEFDVSFAGRDYADVIRDICDVAPSMMRYDSDLMEAFDDAFRTEPKQIDRIKIYGFIKKYRGALSGLDIDFLEQE